jgi:hypothetical protein
MHEANRIIREIGETGSIMLVLPNLSDRKISRLDFAKIEGRVVNRDTLKLGTIILELNS